ncbi:MAG: hypothetical protein C5B55_14590 [Blastocatellia bacterium]|nr:MAG: hypothetical protein C5B55_14590 [Blastocatellia bacterium]
MVPVILLTGFVTCSATQILAQANRSEESPLCTRENALDTIKQQLALSKTFDDSIRRITVLIRAADLLWPYEQTKARAVFAEAFELATENEKWNAQNGSRVIILRLRVPDQRYVVIRAVAKREPKLAKQFTEQMLKSIPDTGRESARDSFESVLTSERLLDSAIKLIATDVNASMDLAAASFNYPASSALTRFLYRLSEINQKTADHFYGQALAVYGDKPMKELLYLQAYPFAWSNTLNTPIFSFYVVPPNFVTNQTLQRQFIQVLLQRAQQALETPLAESDRYQSSDGYLRPGPAHLLEGLIRLEPQVRESFPDLLAPLIQAREKILVSLSVEDQKILLQPGREVSTAPEKTFDERIELAQKESDMNERDELTASTVMSDASDKESLDHVTEIIDKINDSNLRAQLVEWLYFQRATAAIKNKELDEAERLVSRAEGPEQRAYLHTEIARELLKRREALPHAREILEAAIAEAKKGGTTIFAARALLTASTLYAKIDLSRSFSILADAVNCINRLEAPDFVSDDQAVEKAVTRIGKGGQNRGQYLFRFYMPGLDPESAFREMAKINFDNSLAQSAALTDKFQRALSTLALEDVCLQQPQRPNAKAKKKSM